MVLNTPSGGMAFGPAFGGMQVFGPGGPPGSPNVSNLLTLAEDGAVWDEIKIGDEQLGKVKRLRAAITKQFRQLREEIRAQQAAPGGGAGGPPVNPAAMLAARQAERQAIEESAGAIREQTDAALKKILKPAQFSRLQQIDLQAQGPLVIVRPDVARALNLSSDQVEQAQTVIDQARSTGREQMMRSGREFFESLQTNNSNNQQPPTDPEAMRERFQTHMEQMRTSAQGLEDSAVQQVTRILTKAQRTKFNAMLGPPFDLALLNDGRGSMNNLIGGLPRGGPTGPGGGNPSTAAPKNAPGTKDGAPAAKGSTTTRTATKR
jgi:hypothetical protein